jgi:hypothetical protein
VAAIAPAAATMRRRVNSVMASSGKQRLAPTAMAAAAVADATHSGRKTEGHPKTDHRHGFDSKSPLCA